MMSVTPADLRFLNRAERLATMFAIDLAAQSGGQIWEHYDDNWNVDLEYNIDNPNDRYKPWPNSCLIKPWKQVGTRRMAGLFTALRPMAIFAQT